MHYPRIILHQGREQSLLRRHQWIFSKAIQKKDKAVRDGDLVSVADAGGNILATGHYQDSSLSIRILEFADVQIDEVFWKRKLGAAMRYRHALMLPSGDTTAFRLVHGEGDELPGMVVDIYDNIAVLQAHSIGVYRQRQEIADVLMQIEELKLDAVYDKSIEALQQPAGIQTRWLCGQSRDRVPVREHGLEFTIDIEGGQKTGFFLDQRENRKLVKAHAAGKDVLNCFSYTGGFSIYALAGGAANVTSVDISGTALNILEENIRMNRFTGSHTAISDDVMKYLRDNTHTYDLVICDPPAFAKSIHKKHNAVQAYKRLNTQAMKKVRPGGMLFTFSCSQVVDRQLFYDTIVAAAIETGRPARVMFEMSQGADHPVSIFHPEGSYLKGLALLLD